jgi:hypothetical protein
VRRFVIHSEGGTAGPFDSPRLAEWTLVCLERDRRIGVDAPWQRFAWERAAVAALRRTLEGRQN